MKKTEHITINIESSVMDQLKIIADNDRRTVSQLCALIVTDYTNIKSKESKLKEYYYIEI